MSLADLEIMETSRHGTSGRMELRLYGIVRVVEMC